MQIIIIKYIQMFCLALFFSNKIRCDMMLLNEQKEDRKLYEKSACVAQCVEPVENIMTLESCYNVCKEHIDSNKYRNLKQIYENLNIKLICRSDTSFVLKIVESEYEKKNHIAQNGSYFQDETKIFIFKIHETNITTFPATKEIYLTDSRMIEIQNLTASKQYNISAAVVSANNEFSVIAKGVQFSTLEKFYKPDKIFDISIAEYYESPHERNSLNAIISWKPANDMTCFYEILYYATATNNAFGLIQAEVTAPKTLYNYKLENLTFETYYQIGIRGKNPKETSKESDIFWYNFETPSCLKWNKNNLTICPPPTPKGLNVTEKYVDTNMFSINVTWMKPSLNPDYYLIKILDLSTLHLHNPRSFTFNVSKSKNSFFIPEIILYGMQYEIHLSTHSAGGNSSTMITATIERHIEIEEHKHLRLIIVIVVTIFSITFISVVIMIICQRRAKFKRYQKRCRYFEELDTKAPVDSNSNFDFPIKTFSILPSAEQLSQLQQELEEKLFIDDEMEVSRNDIQLFEILGEGAFGLVKKGLLNVDKTASVEVAVKMLKDHASSDDIKAFRREIDVMKAVGKHPNIVSIVGHCTKNVKDLLLITEYCSLGNLLNFLRSEWKYLNRIIQPSKGCNVSIVTANLKSLSLEMIEKQEESIFNFDTSHTGKVPLKYKNINDNKENLKNNEEPNGNGDDGALTSLVVNKSYELNGTCTSACKCHVDIISNKCLISDSQDSDMNTSEVKIQNCDCSGSKSYENSTETLLIENKSYYKMLQDNEQENQNHQESFIAGERQPLKSTDLLHIAKQIAMGMEFLSKNKVVHRDLAARNILVCQNRTVKIADFGLSRDIYQENIYKKTGNGKLPIKWLALECMTHQIYTTQSDVWSYGILLYEIVTLGGTPYPLIPTNRLLKLLKTGYRMEKPRNCDQNLYNLMLSCWHMTPNVRPIFSDICQSIDNLMTSPLAENLINLNFAEHNKGTRSWSDESYLKPI